MKSPKIAYKGKIFNTRLCARWAVYFEVMGIEYLYNPKIFTFIKGLNCLPDFYLPGLGAWVEVCASPVLDSFEFEKVRSHCIDTKKPVIILKGEPALKSYTSLFYDKQVNGKVNTVSVNIIPDNGGSTGLLESLRLSGTQDFVDFSKVGIRAIRAVIHSQNKLFETINKTEEMS